jgi:hypothetical protein
MMRVECGLLLLLASFILLAFDEEKNWLSHGHVVVVSGSMEFYTEPSFLAPIFNFFLP